jgi:hypothetical protein
MLYQKVYGLFVNKLNRGAIMSPDGGMRGPVSSTAYRAGQIASKVAPAVNQVASRINAPLKAAAERGGASLRNAASSVANRLSARPQQAPQDRVEPELYESDFERSFNKLFEYDEQSQQQQSSQQTGGDFLRYYFTQQLANKRVAPDQAAELTNLATKFNNEFYRTGIFPKQILMDMIDVYLEVSNTQTPKKSGWEYSDSANSPAVSKGDPEAAINNAFKAFQTKTNPTEGTLESFKIMAQNIAVNDPDSWNQFKQHVVATMMAVEQQVKAQQSAT